MRVSSVGAINKAGFVAPGLLFSHVIRCHKKRLRTIAFASEQLDVHRATFNVNLSWLKVEEVECTELSV
jgi:hypothetical protein